MAENQVNKDKMAVSAVDHNMVNKTNDLYHNDSDSDRKSNYEANTKKKSCFQITRVITKSGGSDQLDNDIDDDLDETNTESFDVSKTNDTDFDQQSDDTLSAHSIPAGSEEFAKDLNKSSVSSSTPQAVLNSRDHIQSGQLTFVEGNSVPVGNDVKLSLITDNATAQDHHQSVPQKDKPSESRFKVVKIESKEPFRRGRWSCQDYLDPPASEKSDKVTVEEIGSHGSGNSSTASSVHFVPGVDDPSRNPLVDSQNGEFNNQNPNIYSNGTHIAKNATLPSQHVSNQVPSSMTQTHVQNILPPSDIGSQYQTSSLPQGVGNGQPPSSQQSFSQANISSQSVSNTPQSQVQNETSTDFIPSQSDYIPNTARHPNAQTSQETSLSQQVQSSTSQEFNSNVQTNFRTAQNVDVRNTNANSESVHSSKSEFNTQELGYSSTSSNLEKAGQQSEASDQESTDRDTVLKVAGGTSIFTPPLLEMVSQKMNPNDKDDESGASTVAIDNKIEQAMDLVKSHLMYAVREEVEVLREQIKELLEKNSQLEYENSILRQAASAETLSKLQQPRPTPRGTGGGPSSQAPPSSSTS